MVVSMHLVDCWQMLSLQAFYVIVQLISEKVQFKRQALKNPNRKNKARQMSGKVFLHLDESFRKSIDAS